MDGSQRAVIDAHSGHQHRGAGAVFPALGGQQAPPLRRAALPCAAQVLHRKLKRYPVLCCAELAVLR